MAGESIRMVHDEAMNQRNIRSAIALATRARDGNRSVEACPACQGDVFRVVGGVASEFEEVVAGRVFVHPSYSIRCCSRCGLLFKSQTPDFKILEDYYGLFDCEVFAADHSFPTDRILRSALSRLPAGSKVLDFGCSTGRILGPWTQRHACFGIEINARAAEIAHGRGIRIIKPEQLKTAESSSFDVVLLCDVYEHVSDPLQIGRLLCDSLRPGGLLLIVTGNADAIRTREHIGEFWYFRCFGHLLMMNETHAKWLASQLHMKLAALHRCSHYSPPLMLKCREAVQSFAYHQLKRQPTGLMSRLIRRTPVLRRAASWKTSPALTYRADHFVAVFEKTRLFEGNEQRP